jgi:helicase
MQKALGGKESQQAAEAREWAKAKAAGFGYESLNPMQQHAIAQGLLDGSNVLVTAPTASGKTLLALLSIAKHFKDEKAAGGKKTVVYVVPLRALASEKYEEFKAAFPERKVGISTGDYDSGASHLLQYDLLVMTSEKLDSVLRHDKEFVKRIGLAIIDEVHLLDDDYRGATVEIVLTKLLIAESRLLCLSATVPNHKEIAGWMCAKPIRSDYRPTKLEIGICDKKTIVFEENEGGPEEIDEKFYLENLCRKAVVGSAQGIARDAKAGGQAIVFVATRPSAEASAENVSVAIAPHLAAEQKASLDILAKKVHDALPTPTTQCARLAKCIRNGTAFHHAGIPERQRKLIESGFKKERAIKVIVATTTLAMGIDYPASWVIVRDLKRFGGNFSSFIPALEIKQMLGRAGRPRYDKVGYGVLVCSANEKREVAEKYIYGDLEDIYSKLSSEPTLRVHCLALIASKYCNDFRSLFGFFSRTFFACHYGSAQELLEKVESVVSDLERMGFVAKTKGDALVASPLGKRTSELYLDPQTAYAYIKSFKTVDLDNSIGFICNLCNSTEMRPYLSVGRAEEQKLFDDMYASSVELYPDWEYDSEALQKYKTARALNAWANEANEQQMLSDFDLAPGILNARVRIAEWLCYSYSELAKIAGFAAVARKSLVYQERIKDGIREELIPICRVRGIGRVRGRKLFDAGIRTREAYDAAPKDRLKAILGGKAMRQIEE